jgi:hypothetical protein
MERLSKFLQQLRKQNGALEDSKERLTPDEFLVDTDLAEVLKDEGRERVQALRVSLRQQVTVRF